jgi:prepilin-type N-terminal cleavage/methylation domain-containing protein
VIPVGAMRIANTRRQRLSRDSGFTLIEVMVAMAILATGALALVMSFDSSRRLATDAELRDVAATVARGEIERLESLSWSNLALAAAPTKNGGATTKDPTYYISTTECTGSPKPSSCYEWDWGNTSSYEGFVINASTTDTATNPKSWEEAISTANGNARVSGSTYRFITWVNDTHCKASGCSSEGYKRLTVAVTSSRLNSPVTLSTVWTNPAGGKTGPLEQEGVKCLDGGSKVACTD